MVNQVAVLGNLVKSTYTVQTMGIGRVGGDVVAVQVVGGE